MRAQLGQRIGAADDDIALDPHSGVAEALHFLVDDLFGQAEFRDAIHEHATGLVQGFIDGDVVAAFGEFARGGEAGGAAADHGDLFPGGRGPGGDRARVVHRPVGDKAFEVADGHRLALDAAHAFGLALDFLRAHAAGDARQGVVAQQASGGAREVALARTKVDKARDVHADRAAGHALGILALDAALRLEQREVFGEAEVDLAEIVRARGGVLLGHGLALDAAGVPSGRKFRGHGG